MTTLLTLPPEVLEHCLFPFLQWNDLLRLRRVSKASKVLVHDYVKANPIVAPEIEIGKENERNVKAFMDLELPVAKIYLSNNLRLRRSEFYQDNSEELTRFLEVYGSVVTHLRVDHFSLHCSGMERSFLEGLVNLQSFEAEWFDTTKVEGVDIDIVPPVFGNVTTLKLRSHGNVVYEGESGNDGLNGLIELLNHCRMLETLRPLSIYNPDDNSIATKLFRFLNDAIQQREDNPEGATLSKLKVIDLDFTMLQFLDICEDDDKVRAYNDFGQFIKSCAAHGIQLRGVEMEVDELKDLSRNLGNLLMPLASLSLESHEPHDWTWVIETEMPFLESIKLSTSRPDDEVEAEDIMRGNDNHRVISHSANWPMLKSLELQVDVVSNGCMEVDEDYARIILQEARTLVGCFFEGICRTALTELSLSFGGEVGNDILTVECLTSCCPNLKKLELCNWDGNNEQFVRLWEGLPNLEEVDLDCDTLGNAGFIGPDVQNPVFLNLKKLRKLTLRLGSMPGITDNLFISVIRHLSLTHFTITSGHPLKKVTRKGIKSLLDGRFGESIQKFSFQGWSLHLATPRQNRNLQKLFADRLSNML